MWTNETADYHFPENVIDEKKTKIESTTSACVLHIILHIVTRITYIIIIIQ